MDDGVGAVTMGRPKKNQGTEPPTMTVKIDRALAKKAQMIATDRGLDMAAFISEALRPVVEKEWARMVQRADKQEPKF